MSRIRKLLIMSGATAALSVATLGAIPAAAADTQGTLAIVNGVPGRRLDVCVNGNEIKSGLRYGKAVFRNVISTGEKILKFYDPDPRTCKGHLRAEHDGFTLAAGDDFTVVVTKNGPKRSSSSTTPAVARSRRQGRRWPRAGPVPQCLGDRRELLHSRSGRRAPRDPDRSRRQPARRQGRVVRHWDWHRLHLAAPRSPVRRTLTPSRFRKATTQASRRYEFIFVGSTEGNAKIVLLDRATSQPSP